MESFNYKNAFLTANEIRSLQRRTNMERVSLFGQVVGFLAFFGGTFWAFVCMVMAESILHEMSAMLGLVVAILGLILRRLSQ